MVNEQIKNLPESVILAIRSRCFTVRPDVNVYDLRILSRVLNNAFHEGIDVMPLMATYASLVDNSIERPAQCWSSDTRSIHDAIWPFMASTYAMKALKNDDLPYDPSINEFTAYAREWIAAKEAEDALPTEEADALIRAEMERVRDLYPNLGMSYGYIGNCSLGGAPLYDDRCFRVFTQVRVADGIEAGEYFGGYPLSRLGKLHTLVMNGLEQWAKTLNDRLESGEKTLRSTTHLKVA